MLAVADQSRGVLLLVADGFGGLDEAARSRDQGQDQDRAVRQAWTSCSYCHTLL
jgi:hypothetical protein